MLAEIIDFIHQASNFTSSVIQISSKTGIREVVSIATEVASRFANSLLWDVSRCSEWCVISLLAMVSVHIQNRDQEDHPLENFFFFFWDAFCILSLHKFLGCSKCSFDFQDFTETERSGNFHTWLFRVLFSISEEMLVLDDSDSYQNLHWKGLKVCKQTVPQIFSVTCSSQQTEDNLRAFIEMKNFNRLHLLLSHVTWAGI